MAHDKELSDRLLDLSLRNSPEDPALLRARAEAAWNQGNKDEGITFMERAAKYAPRGDNSYHYTLGYFYEATGQPDKAVAVTRDAIHRNPNDLRAWIELATISGRASGKPNLWDEELLRHKKNSLDGFQGVARLQEDNVSKDVSDAIAKLTNEIAELEKQSEQTTPAP